MSNSTSSSNNDGLGSVSLSTKFSAFAKSKANQWRFAERKAEFAIVVQDKKQGFEKYSLDLSKKGREKMNEWKKNLADYEQNCQVPFNTTRTSYNARTMSAPLSSAQSRQQLAQNDMIFGQPLFKAVIHTRIQKNPLKLSEREKYWTPAIIIRCIEYIDRYGLQETGIYRISGSASNVGKIRKAFATGSDVDIYQEIGEDPHAVASLLKAYFRELPENILTDEFLPQFNEVLQRYTGTSATSSYFSQSCIVANIPPGLSQELALIIAKLPPYNFYLLKVMVRHLQKVHEASEKNKMPISNLALIFCLTLNLSSPLFQVLLTEQVFVNGCVTERDFKETYGPPVRLSETGLPFIKDVSCGYVPPIADSFRDDFKDFLIDSPSQTTQSSCSPKSAHPSIMSISPISSNPSSFVDIKTTPPIPRVPPRSRHSDVPCFLPQLDFSRHPSLDIEANLPFADSNGITSKNGTVIHERAQSTYIPGTSQFESTSPSLSSSIRHFGSLAAFTNRSNVRDRRRMFEPNA